MLVNVAPTHYLNMPDCTTISYRPADANSSDGWVFLGQVVVVQDYQEGDDASSGEECEPDLDPREPWPRAGSDSGYLARGSWVPLGCGRMARPPPGEVYVSCLIWTKNGER